MTQHSDTTFTHSPQPTELNTDEPIAIDLDQYITQRLMDNLNLDHLQVSSTDGHFLIVAAGPCFERLSPVKQQQLIYGQLMDLIQNNTIHAVSIQSYSPAEWKYQQKLNPC